MRTFRRKRRDGPGSTASVARRVSIARYSQVSATIAPSWMKISNVGSPKPMIRDATIRCPVDDTGMNSVRPSTTPRTVAFRSSIIASDGRQAWGAARI